MTLDDLNTERYIRGIDRCYHGGYLSGALDFLERYYHRPSMFVIINGLMIRSGNGYLR